MEDEKIGSLDAVELQNASSSSDTAELQWTEEEEVALRRKMDWYIVPLVTLLYILCFLDRVNIGNARIQGMAKDLDLVGYRFNWALSVFYITYIFIEFPSAYALKRVGPKYWIPFLVAGFGLISLCTAFVTNFAGLCAARAMLGILEGGTMPGIAFFLSCFYKRHELYFRIGIYVSGASIAGAFGGLLATALSRIPRWGIESAPLHTWRNIFFFEGLITLLIGLAAPMVMPSGPGSAWFLNERERTIAVERLMRDCRENAAEKVETRHVKRALMNVNNYVCALIFFLGNITVQGVSVFLPTILQDLGWTNTRAQLYSVPPYILASIVSIAIAFVSDRTRYRGLYLALFAPIAITGFAILRWETTAGIRYMAVYFVLIGAFPVGAAALAWANNNASGPAIRAVSSAYVVTIGTVGGIVSTWTYISKDAPLYHTGHLINLGGQAGIFALACFGIAYCTWENRMRDAGKRDARLQGITAADEAELGYRHPNFRYMP